MVPRSSPRSEPSRVEQGTVTPQLVETVVGTAENAFTPEFPAVQEMITERGWTLPARPGASGNGGGNSGEGASNASQSGYPAQTSFNALTLDPTLLYGPHPLSNVQTLWPERYGGSRHTGEDSRLKSLKCGCGRRFPCEHRFRGSPAREGAVV